MKKLISILLLLIIFFQTHEVLAQDLATCGDSEGYAYFVFHGLIDEKSSGWSKDKISGGIVSLKKTEKGFDILFVDSRKNIISSVGEGGNVSLVNHSKDDAIFIIYYPDQGTLEVYKFFKDQEGKLKYLSSNTRSNVMPIVKSSVMVGDCTFIDFENIK